jgi:putative ABC transport system ATP-binding protein
MANDTIISAKGVKKLYVIGKEKLWALGGVDLDIRRGEYLSIMGPSGSGKSTLFNAIGGLDTPTEGSVTIDGKATAEMTEGQIAYLRCMTIGYIFQTFNLIDVMTALENVTLPMVFAGVSEEEASDRGHKLLDQVGLSGRYDHRPTQLSGGQQQRVACARSLANSPSIILADEPTGNLDLKTGEEIIALLGKLKDELGVTIISATHDHKMLAASDRVVYLEDGKVVDIKTKDQIHISFGEIDGSEH